MVLRFSRSSANQTLAANQRPGLPLAPASTGMRFVAHSSSPVVLIPDQKSKGYVSVRSFGIVH